MRRVHDDDDSHKKVVFCTFTCFLLRAMLEDVQTSFFCEMFLGCKVDNKGKIDDFVEIIIIFIEL
jgi:hypothetical protein